MGNWDFAGDEVVFFLVAGIIALIGLVGWYLRLIRCAGLSRNGGIRLLLALLPPMATGGLWYVLTHWADPQYVVGQLDYQLLFLAGGMAWMWIIGWLLPYFGVSPWEDALERSNPAAAATSAGALLGAMAIYAACNVGSGPTIWTTLAPAFVGSMVWLGIWLIVELLSGPSESIAVERDLAAGVRHGGMLLAAGLILGRALAGDWTSWESTYREMLELGWPVLILAAGSIVYNKMHRPTPERPIPSSLMLGWVPALALLALTIGYVVALGPADIGKHVITYEEYMRSK